MLRHCLVGSVTVILRGLWLYDLQKPIALSLWENEKWLLLS